MSAGTTLRRSARPRKAVNYTEPSDSEFDDPANPRYEEEFASRGGSWSSVHDLFPSQRSWKSHLQVFQEELTHENAKDWLVAADQPIASVKGKVLFNRVSTKIMSACWRHLEGQILRITCLYRKPNEFEHPWFLTILYVKKNLKKDNGDEENVGFREINMKMVPPLSAIAFLLHEYYYSLAVDEMDPELHSYLSTLERFPRAELVSFFFGFVLVVLFL